MKIFEHENVKLLNCDMFGSEGFPSIESASIDAIITDFPYGTLNKRNKWDEVIDYKKILERSVSSRKKNDAYNFHRANAFHCIFDFHKLQDFQIYDGVGKIQGDRIP